ncbi:MAG: DUF739 family protein [Christensenellales bacterium]|jgi:hypothetical protein
MFDYSKLIGRIIEKFKTQKAFAKAMKLSANTWSNKVSGKIEFKSSEMYRAVKLLGLTVEDIPEYFFTPNV